MTSKNESGHAKNVANLGLFNTFISGYGETYNPTKESLKLTALQEMKAKADASLNVVNNLFADNSNAIAAREVAFESIDKFGTRILNAIKSTDTSEQVDDNAKTLVRKLQGGRAKAKLTEEEKKTLTEAGQSTKEISSSQLSFDNRLDNFDKLIQLLISVPQYAPNEEDLKTESLQVFYTNLKALNIRAAETTVALSNARIARNEILYKPLTGIVDTVFDAKTYIKSVFGAQSPQYKQVSALDFKAIK